MIITPIAWTSFHTVPQSVAETSFAERVFRKAAEEGIGSGIDELHEFAGRGCYKSWNLPNPKTETNQAYLEHIEEVGHYSVLEHGQVTFYVEAVSRSLLLELERHGRNSHLSFSVESQRYVSTSGAHPEPILPPLFSMSGEVGVKWGKLYADYYRDLLAIYDECYQEHRDAGFGVKESREAARAILPNMTPVDFVVTADIRGWREVIEKRNDAAADKEIQAFAAKILSSLRDIAPASVQDIPGAE